MSCSVCAGYSSYNCPCCSATPEIAVCPHCKGEGSIYEVIEISTGKHYNIVDIDKYAALPETLARALERESDLYQGEIFRCDECEGEGEIFVEEWREAHGYGTITGKIMYNRILNSNTL